jgi:hypothetical protein
MATKGVGVKIYSAKTIANESKRRNKAMNKRVKKENAELKKALRTFSWK